MPAPSHDPTRISRSSIVRNPVVEPDHPSVAAGNPAPFQRRTEGAAAAEPPGPLPWMKPTTTQVAIGSSECPCLGPFHTHPASHSAESRNRWEHCNHCSTKRLRPRPVHTGRPQFISVSSWPSSSWPSSSWRAHSCRSSSRPSSSWPPTSWPPTSFEVVHQPRQRSSQAVSPPCPVQIGSCPSRPVQQISS